MEDNIKIFQLDPNTFEYQDYNPTDENLITQNQLDTNFIESTDYIEFYIFDENQNLIYPSTTIPLTSYNVKQGDILLNPSNDLENLGFDIDIYNILYLFYRKRLSSNTASKYFIKEISSDRTEVRLDSNNIDNDLIISSSQEFIQYRENSPYFVDFLLNFGDNKTVIANNLRLDTTDSEDPTILIKLYNPLPEEFSEKSELWVVEEISTPQLYQVEFPFNPTIEEDFEFIAGPNFSLDVKNVSNNTTQEFSYNTLINSNITSSNSELENLLEERGIHVNINYEDFNDFVHFSSAKTRLENFIYKVKLIEDINTNISSLNSSLNNTSNPTFITEKESLDNRKNDIIKNFDGYERFLYFTSGSQYTYPKSNLKPPFNLFPSTDSNVDTWLEFITPLTEEYDLENQNLLKYTIPEYLREDPENQKYDLFLDMVGQHYDNIWVYTKNISNRFSGDNRLDYGISKDLVKDAVEDFGIKLYSNNFDINDLYTSFLGITLDGSTFPYPNMTGSLPTPTGFEYVDTYITSSDKPIPLNDLDKRIQKRIYHNIPFLLKTKGTLRGLRALITSYGIPDSILSTNEFVSSKIQLKENLSPDNPSGSDTTGITLSPLRSIQQKETGSKEYNKNYLEVGFSIQDVINGDISSSLGDFNLGEYIGDPRDNSLSSKTYPNLDTLRDTFYSTYSKTKNVKDFIRIIKFFDNSLFKMIKDFTPANTSLSAGVIVKQHNLERNRQRPAQASWEDKTYEGQIKSYPFNYEETSLVKTQGGTGGAFEKFNGLETSNSSSQYGLFNRFGITQSYEETLDGPLGSRINLIFNQDEFYNGEFSGSTLEITDQNLNPGCDPYKKVPDIPISYKPFIFNTSVNTTTNGTVTNEGFSNPLNAPSQGEIWLLSEIIDNSSGKTSSFTLGPSNLTTSITGGEYKITKIKISNLDIEGIEISNYINNSLQRVEVKFNNKNFVIFINGFTQFSTYSELNVDPNQGSITFNDDNLRYNDGIPVSNVYDSDLGEKGSKNFLLRANGNFTNFNNLPHSSQGDFTGEGRGGVTQYIRYYNGDIEDLNNSIYNFNPGSAFAFELEKIPYSNYEWGSYTLLESPNVPLRFLLNIKYSASDNGVEAPEYLGNYHFHTSLDPNSQTQLYDLSNGSLNSFYPSSFPNISEDGELDPSIFDLNSTSDNIVGNSYNPTQPFSNGSPLLIFSGSADLNFNPSGLRYDIGYEADSKYRPLSGSSISPTGNVDITGSLDEDNNTTYEYNRGDKDGLFILRYPELFAGATGLNIDTNEEFQLNVDVRIRYDINSSSNFFPKFFTLFVATGSIDNNEIPTDGDYIQYSNTTWSPGSSGGVVIQFPIPSFFPVPTQTFIFNREGLTNELDGPLHDLFIKPMIKSEKNFNYKLIEYKISFDYLESEGEDLGNEDGSISKL